MPSGLIIARVCSSFGCVITKADLLFTLPNAHCCSVNCFLNIASKEERTTTKHEPRNNRSIVYRSGASYSRSVRIQNLQKSVCGILRPDEFLRSASQNDSSIFCQKRSLPSRENIGVLLYASPQNILHGIALKHIHQAAYMVCFRMG